MLTRVEGLAIGQPGQAILLGQRVPAGMVWEISAAGIGTDSNITWAVDYALNKAHATFGNGSDWYIPLPISRLNAFFHGTPMVALAVSPLRLYPGQALMARANGLGAEAKMDLFYEGIQYPMAWLERRLKAEGGAGGEMPDLTAFIAQTQAAAAALAAIQPPQ